MSPPDETRLNKACNRWLSESPSDAVDWYLSRFGRTINVDRAREMSLEYLEDPSRFADAVHEPSSRLAKMVYTKCLDDIKAQGGSVLFLAGGGGSGKSYALDQIAGFTLNDTDVIYDGTMSDFMSASKKIDEALFSGAEVRIVYVNREAVNALSGPNSVIDRAVKEGRTVPIEKLASAHAGAAETIKRIAECYGSKVRIEILNNDGKTVEVGSIADVPTYDEKTLLRKMRYELEKARSEGRITDKIHDSLSAYQPDGYRRGSGPAERVEQGGNNRRGGIEASGRSQEESACQAPVSLFKFNFRNFESNKSHEPPAPR